MSHAGAFEPLTNYGQYVQVTLWRSIKSIIKRTCIMNVCSRLLYMESRLAAHYIH
jgi:hypothetical protein